MGDRGATTHDHAGYRAGTKPRAWWPLWTWRSSGSSGPSRSRRPNWPLRANGEPKRGCIAAHRKAEQIASRCNAGGQPRRNQCTRLRRDRQVAYAAEREDRARGPKSGSLDGERGQPRVNRNA